MFGQSRRAHTLLFYVHIDSFPSAVCVHFLSQTVLVASLATAAAFALRVLKYARGARWALEIVDRRGKVTARRYIGLTLSPLTAQREEGDIREGKQAHFLSSCAHYVPCFGYVNDVAS